MNHEEGQSLLGAYALDAVGEEEALALERHLQECPRCRQELHGYMESATALGSGGGEAPENLWDQIAAGLEDRQPPLLVMPASRPARPRLSRAALALVGAAALALAFLGWDVAHLDSRVGQLQSAVSQSHLAQVADAAALSSSDSQVTLRSANRSARLEVAVSSSGQAYVYSSTLPRLAAGKTYQLWGLAGTKVVSLGLLGREPSPSAFRVSSRTRALMVTVEPAGGVSAPTNPVLVRATL